MSEPLQKGFVKSTVYGLPAGSFEPTCVVIRDLPLDMAVYHEAFVEFSVNSMGTRLMHAVHTDHSGTVYLELACETQQADRFASRLRSWYVKHELNLGMSVRKGMTAAEALEASLAGNDADEKVSADTCTFSSSINRRNEANARRNEMFEAIYFDSEKYNIKRHTRSESRSSSSHPSPPKE